MNKQKKKLVRLFVAISVSSLKIFNKEFLKPQTKKRKDKQHEEKNYSDYIHDSSFPDGNYR